MRELGLFLGINQQVMDVDFTTTDYQNFRSRLALPAIDPATLGGIFHHADDLSVGAVATWPNRVGGTNSTSHGTVVPVCAANFGNFLKKSVVFNGTTNWYRNDTTKTWLKNTSDFTGWALVMPVTTAAASCVFGANGSVSWTQLGVQNTTPSRAFMSFKNDATSVGADYVKGATAYASTDPIFIVWRYSRNNQMEIFINGLNVSLVNTGRGLVPNGLTHLAGAVGAGLLNGVGAFSGNIRACGVHPSYLTNSQLIGIQNYLDVLPLNLICDGNSITYGIGGTPYTTQIKPLLRECVDVYNVGVGGAETRDLLSHRYNYPSPNKDIGATILTAWEATNDLYYQGNAGARDPVAMSDGAWARWCEFIDLQRKTNDFSAIIAPTIIKRGSWADPTSSEAARELFNQKLKSSALGGDIVPDIAADAIFQNTAGTGYADGTHPSTLGYGTIATYIAGVVNAF